MVFHRSRRRFALAPTLAAVSAAIMLLLTLFMVHLVGRSLAQDSEADIGRGLAELAFQTTDKLDRGMYERYREVKLMAGRYEIGSPVVPVAAKRAVLDSMQETHSYYAWVGLTDLRGVVQIASKSLLEGKDVSGRPWYAAAYKGVHLHDVHDAVLLAKLLPRGNGEPKRFFDIAFPYHTPDGAIAGVLGTHLSWQWAADVERSVLRPLAQRKAVDTLILSKEGVVLLGPKDYLNRRLALPSYLRAQVQQDGFGVETWPDGKRYLVGFSRSQGHESYPGLGWIVLVRQPIEDAFKPVEQLRSTILWAGVGAAALVSLLVWIFSRNISRPLATIAGHADALRTGLAQDIPYVHSRLSEVQILQDALNALWSKLRTNEQGLRELNATLETRVAERTAALAGAVQETRRGEQRLRAVIDTALDAFVGVDAGGLISDWNPRAEEIFGWTRAEVIGKALSETLIPSRFRHEHQAGMQRFSQPANLSVIGRRLLLCAVRRDGAEFPVEMTIGVINADDSHFFGIFIQDISVRKGIEDELACERERLKEAARRLEASERRLRTITNNLPVLIGYIDKEERYQFANATYEEWFARPHADIVGRTVQEVMGEAVQDEQLNVRQRNMLGETVRFELQVPAHDTLRTVEITRIPDIHEGCFNGVYVLGADITAVKQQELALSRLARIDALTGLPNRRAYHEHLEAALQRAQRSGQGLALMFLDVDHFKSVNDTLGHAAGDSVLQEFARRVKGAVRVTDTVCRLAGDEFTVILEGVKSSEQAALVAAKIVQAFEPPFAAGQVERQVTTSIGVAFAEVFPTTAPALEALADQALYAAKRAGRRGYALLAMPGHPSP